MRGFDFLSPTSLNAALRAVGESGPNYKVLAGGTNLIADLRAETARPRVVIDLGRVKTLKYIKESGGKMRIGSLTTIRQLLDSRLIKKRAPILWEAMHHFAGPLVRNRATVGGNLVDASPAADTAIPLLALKAQVKLQSIKGPRTLPLQDFFTGYKKTVTTPGEILTEVIFPVTNGRKKYGYYKLGRRNAMAISVASVGVVMSMKGKTCTDATIAVGAVAPTPLRVEKAESVLKGRKVDAKIAVQCGAVTVKSIRPIDDLRASAEYRKTVCDVLVRRLICHGVGINDSV
jgi:carbon-monoxide dehydrogenase medium subunit